jgi:hypothetical protein
MNEATPPAQTRRPRLGLSAEVAGVIGAILCVVLVIGIWMGRGWFSSHADAFVADADKALAKATQISNTAIAALESRAVEVDGIATDSGTVAADPSAASGVLQPIVTRLSGVAQKYGSARDDYLTLKTRVSTTLDTLGRLDNLVPSLTVPPGIKEALGKVDAGLTNMDAALTSLSQSATNLADTRAQASAIATAATAFASELRTAEGVGKDLQTGLADLETRLTDSINTVDGWIGMAAIVFTLLFIWVFVLNLALWVLGRRWRAA